VAAGPERDLLVSRCQFERTGRAGSRAIPRMPYFRPEGARLAGVTFCGCGEASTALPVWRHGDWPPSLKLKAFSQSQSAFGRWNNMGRLKMTRRAAGGSVLALLAPAIGRAQGWTNPKADVAPSALDFNPGDQEYVRPMMTAASSDLIDMIHSHPASATDFQTEGGGGDPSPSGSLPRMAPVSAQRRRRYGLFRRARQLCG